MAPPSAAAVCEDYFTALEFALEHAGMDGDAPVVMANGGDDHDADASMDILGGFQSFRRRSRAVSEPVSSLMVSLADAKTSRFSGDAEAMADLMLAHGHSSMACSRDEALAWTSSFKWNLLRAGNTTFSSGGYACEWRHPASKRDKPCSCLESLFGVAGSGANHASGEIRFLAKRDGAGVKPKAGRDLPMLLRTVTWKTGGIGRLFPEELALQELIESETVAGGARRGNLAIMRLFEGKAPPAGEEHKSKDLQRILAIFLHALAQQVQAKLANPLLLPVWRCLAERAMREQGSKAKKGSEATVVADVTLWLKAHGVARVRPATLRAALDECACLDGSPRAYHKRWPELRQALLLHREKEFGIPRSCEPNQLLNAWANSGFRALWYPPKPSP